MVGKGSRLPGPDAPFGNSRQNVVLGITQSEMTWARLPLRYAQQADVGMAIRDLNSKSTTASCTTSSLRDSDSTKQG